MSASLGESTHARMLGSDGALSGRVQKGWTGGGEKGGWRATGGLGGGGRFTAFTRRGRRVGQGHSSVEGCGVTDRQTDRGGTDRQTDTGGGGFFIVRVRGAFPDRTLLDLCLLTQRVSVTLPG